MPESLFQLSCRPAATLLKKRLCHRCFPVSFAKFLRTSIFKEHYRWLFMALHLFVIFTISSYSLFTLRAAERANLIGVNS